jgi:GTP-binding protein EngB required for normal cell division
LPGYGFANIGKEQKFNISKSLGEYLLKRPSLLAVFVLFDIRRGIRPDDECMCASSIRCWVLTWARRSPRACGLLACLLASVCVSFAAAIVQLLDEHDRDFVLVATKVDKLSATARRAALEQITAEYDLPDGQPIEFSSVTGEGREAIWQYIRQAKAEYKPPPLPGRPVWGRGAVS